MKYQKVVIALVAFGTVILSSNSFAEDSLFSYQSIGLEASSQNSNSPVVSRSTAKMNRSAIKRGFEVNLPDGKKLFATLKSEKPRTTKSGYSTTSYSGELDSLSGIKSSTPGDFHISITKGPDGKEGISGVFRSNSGEEYILKQSSGDLVQLVKIDSSKQLDCKGPARSHEHLMLPKKTNKRTASDISAADSSIRILVAYTPDAIDTAGSESALISQITQLVDSTNEAHQNSQTGASYTLVGTYALSTRSNDNFSQELNQATNTGDGKWDELGTLRQQYCADAISVIVGGTNNQTICGIAWLGADANQMALYGDLMYSLVSANTEICSSLTFAHELGHNLGSDHDFPNSGQDAAYNYSYGHRFTGNSSQQFRTVMAYAPGTRIPYFSNPDVTYDGVSTGVAGSANNALSIAQTWSIVSSFYSEGESCVTTTPGTGGGSGGGSGAPPSSVNLTFTKKASAGKTKIKATLTGLDSSGGPASDVTLGLYFDTKSTGSFTKLLGSGITGTDGTTKINKTIKKNGHLIACYNSGDVSTCSSIKKVRVKKKR